MALTRHCVNIDLLTERKKMGQLTARLKKDFIKNGFEKKEATKKAHEYMSKYNLCRSCGESIRIDFHSWKPGYCQSCC